MGRLIIVALTLLSAAIFAFPAGRAAAAIDITGHWSLALTHPDFTGTIYCTGFIGQNGTMLSVQMTCDYFGSGNLSGSINTSRGALTLSGTMSSKDQVVFQGTATSNGQAMSGNWTVVGIPAQGSFSGSGTPAVGGVTALSNIGEELSNRGGGPLGVWRYALACASAALLSSLAVGGARWAHRPR